MFRWNSPGNRFWLSRRGAIVMSARTGYCLDGLSGAYLLDKILHEPLGRDRITFLQATVFRCRFPKPPRAWIKAGHKPAILNAEGNALRNDLSQKEGQDDNDCRVYT